MPVPLIGAIEAIGKVLTVVGFLTSGYKLNREAEVAAAIQTVEDQVGLTQDVKWAWNWYDWRYADELGEADEVWDGNNFRHYAGITIKPWYDLGHWQDCLRKSLRRIEHYLARAMATIPPAGLPTFLEKLKKYGPYIALGGGVILSAILIAKATKKER